NYKAAQGNPLLDPSAAPVRSESLPEENQGAERQGKSGQLLFRVRPSEVCGAASLFREGVFSDDFGHGLQIQTKFRCDCLVRPKDERFSIIAAHVAFSVAEL